MATAGSLFAFSAFSEDFRLRMNFSGKDINVMSGVGNAALYLSFLFAGPVYDRFGAKITQLLAFVLYSSGYLLIWLSFQSIIPKSNVFLMSFFYFLAGCGSSTAQVYLQIFNS